VRIGVRLSNTNYFPGLIDDVRIYNKVLTLAEIKKLMAGPRAYYPIPADGALYEDMWVSLSWSPADTAASHDFYFGDNFNDDVAPAIEGADASLAGGIHISDSPCPCRISARSRLKVMALHYPEISLDVKVAGLV